MPELPEIITIRNDLKKEVLGKRIQDIISHKKYKFEPSRAYFDKYAVNSTVTDVFNIGKLLLLKLSSDYFIAIHLKMTGNLLWNISDPYVRMSIIFDDNNTLNYSTVRLFEYFGLWDRQKYENYCKKVAKTPIESDLTIKEFILTLKKASIPIKSALLDQKKIAGLGNIYANESLFLAGINPKRPAKSLSDKEFSTLFNKIKLVLKNAVKNRGSSFNRYKDLYGKPGSQQDHFYVFGKKGQICTRCNKFPIIYGKINGRGSFYCQNCQV